MKMDVVIVASGAGKRFKSAAPKQFLQLEGKPVFLWAVETFLSMKETAKVIVVIPPKFLSSLMKKYKGLKKVVWVCGGKERFDSVRAGLEAVDANIDLVAVHDGVRPLISAKDIRTVFNKAAKTGAAIAASKTRDTIKFVKAGKIVETLDRSHLYNAQTPQIFKRDLIMRAYKNNIPKDITDDCQLVEKLGIAISVVETEFANFKITTRADFNLAKNILGE